MKTQIDFFKKNKKIFPIGKQTQGKGKRILTPK